MVKLKILQYEIKVLWGFYSLRTISSPNRTQIPPTTNVCISKLAINMVFLIIVNNRDPFF